jgi:hypothetical protein
MFGNLIVKCVVKLLKTSSLSLEQKGILLDAIARKIDSLPIRDIIMKSEDGSLIVNGKIADREQAMFLRESAKRDLASKSLALIRDQVLFKALYYTATGCTSFDQIYASKMSVWCLQNEQSLLEMLAGHQMMDEE